MAILIAIVPLVCLLVKQLYPFWPYCKKEGKLCATTLPMRRWSYAVRCKSWMWHLPANFWGRYILVIAHQSWPRDGTRATGVSFLMNFVDAFVRKAWILETTTQGMMLPRVHVFFFITTRQGWVVHPLLWILRWRDVKFRVAERIVMKQWPNEKKKRWRSNCVLQPSPWDAGHMPWGAAQELNEIV